MFCSADNSHCNPSVVFECANNVMSYSSQQKWLSPMQIARMRLFASIGSVSKYASSEDAIIIDENTTWNTFDRFINRDIIVKSGAKFTIADLVLGTTLFELDYHFANGAKIVVERGAILEIDGATLKSNSEYNECLGVQDNWDGIYVTANSNREQVVTDDVSSLHPEDPGIVIVKNNAIISDAPTAIRTRSPYHSDFEALERYGGLIIAEESEFINNKRAIEFMKYDKLNKSTIEDCSFNVETQVGFENSKGITIWDCEGIKIYRNSFTNMGLEGILGINFGADISDANLFQNCRTGIADLSVAGSIEDLQIGRTDLAPNLFIDNERHIQLEASSNTSIHNNTFTTALISIDLNGQCDEFDIYTNEFNEDFLSIRLIETGHSQNLIDCNSFTAVKSIVGVQSIGTNSLTSILGNNFNSSGRLSNVLVSSGSLGNMGNGDTHAHNCFNTNLPIEIRTNPNTQNFSYFLEQGDQSCTFPDNSGQNYSIVNLTNANDPICPMRGVIGQGTNQSLSSFTNLVTSIVTLESQIQNLTPQEIEQLNELKRLRALNEHQMIREAIQVNDTPLLKSIVSLPAGRNDLDLTAYFIQLGFIEAANNIISSMNSASETSEFIQIINHYIAFLADPESFVADSMLLQDLVSISSSNSRMNAHARSFLALISDIRIYSDFVDIDPTEFYRFSSELVELSTNTTVYPNPARFTLNIQSDSQSKLNGSATLYNLHGNSTLIIEDISKSIDVSSLEKGIYILKIKLLSGKTLVHEIIIN